VTRRRPEPAFHFRTIPETERQLHGGQPQPEPAFHFRTIPETERQLHGGQPQPRSGVRFPLHSGRRTPVGGAG
jgi:hypothetical protein